MCKQSKELNEPWESWLLSKFWVQADGFFFIFALSWTCKTKACDRSLKQTPSASDVFWHSQHTHGNALDTIHPWSKLSLPSTGTHSESSQVRIKEHQSTCTTVLCRSAVIYNGQGSGNWKICEFIDQTPHYQFFFFFKKKEKCKFEQVQFFIISFFYPVILSNATLN